MNDTSGSPAERSHLDGAGGTAITVQEGDTNSIPEAVRFVVGQLGWPVLPLHSIRTSEDHRHMRA